MSFFKSIRFRLSVQYSAVVFGLGGALLGIVFLAIRRMLRTQTMIQFVVTGQPVYVDGVLIGRVPTLREAELRTLESLFNEHVLNELARFTVFSLIALFLLSLIVGWIMSGRLLKPVEEITRVAADIQASDLSRRIDLDGPDDEMTRLAATFDRMLERLDQAFSSQRRFLADTSHDLRTPLAVIRSNMELVASDQDATMDDWRDVGEIVTRNTDKMADMIDGLLATARLQIGKAQSVKLDLGAIVEEKVGEYRSIADSHGVGLADLANPVLVDGVEVAVDRALSNLLDNALSVSSDGDVVLVGSGAIEGWAWLAVGDQGPGFPAKTSEAPLGLGLSIVSQIAEAHGGAFASYPRKRGTATVMWLPIDPVAGPHPDFSPFTDS